MSACAAVRIQYCPPMPASDVRDSNPLTVRRRGRSFPVHCPEQNEDGSFQAGLGFDDYARMQTTSRVIGHKHRREIPFWTLNDAATRRVVLSYMESRCWGGKQRATNTGTERERFIRVMNALRERTSQMTVVLGRLCAEYTEHYACTTSFCVARRATLATLISGLDKQLLLASHPDIFYDVVVCYYRQRENSHQIAEHLGWLTPQGVRQIIRRMNIIASRLGYAVEFIPKPTPEQRAVRKAERERVRAARIEMNRERTERRRIAAEQEEKRRAEIAAAPKVARTVINITAERMRRMRGRPSGWRKYSDGLGTRQRWVRDGKCNQCGGKHGARRDGKRMCAFCSDRFAKRTAVRLARAKAERALHRVPKEVWRSAYELQNCVLRVLRRR